jgi:hypothetical protein
MIEAKKEEASKIAADREVEQKERINILDQKVEDDFDVDDI